MTYAPIPAQPLRHAPRKRHGPWLSLLAAAACLLLAACEEGKETRPGQTLATVNGTDITVHQVNAELNALPTQSSVPPADAQKRALETVVDRELLAAQAVQAKLDRDPAIMLAIERSRSQILAQAYLQTRLAQAAPAASEVDDYLHKHPQLFAGRKVYDLRYLAVPAAGMNAEVAAMVDRASSLDELAANLSANKVGFSKGQAYRSSAELPPQLLANLDQVTRRPVFVMRDTEQTLLASLSFVRDDPVAGEEARRQVQQFLGKRKGMATIQEEVARLRRTASVSYTGQPAPAPASTGKPAAAAGGAPDLAAIEAGASGLR